MTSMSERSETVVPWRAGLAWAAMILGAMCVPVSAYIGVHSLAVSLPVFGVWFFLPVVGLAILMGIFASGSAQGAAGAALGVAALVLCLTFVVVDRSYGPEIRAQLRAPASDGARVPIDIERLLRLAE